LLLYLSLLDCAEQISAEPDRSVHRYWIIVPLLGRRWVHSNIDSAEGEPPRVWALVKMNCTQLCALFAGDGMTHPDDVVRVALDKRPASPQSVMPINIYIRLFNRYCDYLW